MNFSWDLKSFFKNKKNDTIVESSEIKELKNIFIVMDY